MFKKICNEKVIVLIIAFFTIINTILLISSLVTNTDNRETTPQTTLRNQREMYKYAEKVFADNVECSDFEIVEADFSNNIQGSIKNVSGKDMCDISLSFVCYDDLGDYIGVNTIYVEYLPADSRYKVNDYAYIDNVHSVKLLRARAYYDTDINP